MKLYCTEQAAAQLGLSARTLERHRVAGTGPAFLKLGKLVRYRETDLEQWVLSRLRRSTSDSQKQLSERGCSFTEPARRSFPAVREVRMLDLLVYSSTRPRIDGLEKFTDAALRPIIKARSAIR